VSFFGKATKKSSDTAPQTVQFLFDQDGPMERTIKAKLNELFADVVQVEQAYFARVSYVGNVQGVALCIYGAPELDVQLLLKGVSAVYGRIVPTDPQGLHTIILTPAQKVDIAKTCHAFFVRRN
jgi:hypothetical protein